MVCLVFHRTAERWFWHAPVSFIQGEKKITVIVKRQIFNYLCLSNGIEIHRDEMRPHIQPPKAQKPCCTPILHISIVLIFIVFCKYVQIKGVYGSVLLLNIYKTLAHRHHP